MADWSHTVRAALRTIDRGGLDKVVPARRVRVRGERRIDPGRLSMALSYLFPACQVLDLRFGRTRLAAATPERLLSLRQGRVEVDAIAGTAPRATTGGRDRELAEGLFRSSRIRTEHELVVRQLGEALAGHTLELDCPDTPRLLQLANVQHLWTPIRGRAAPGEDLLSLARVLHPSPSVSGYPVPAARDWLARHDPLPRGWYTGAFGWLDDHLEGELWVLLRCALLDGDSAELYAGAGLVAGSEAADEYRETEHKLDGMLAALRYA